MSDKVIRILIAVFFFCLLANFDGHCREKETNQSEKMIILQQGLNDYQGCIGVPGGTGNEDTPWLRFDLSSIPKGAKLVKADLFMYCCGSTHAGWRRERKMRDVNNFAYGAMHNTWIYVVRLTKEMKAGTKAPWRRGELPYPVKKVFGEEPMQVMKMAKTDVTISSAEETDTWTKWDLTEMVSWWLQNPENNFGFAWNQYTSEGDYGCGEDNNLQDDHKGHAGPEAKDQSERPRLKVTFIGGGGLE